MIFEYFYLIEIENSTLFSSSGNETSVCGYFVFFDLSYYVAVLNALDIWLGL